MSKLNDEAKNLIAQPIHAWVTTVRDDGSLHSTVVWADVDGDDVIFNTAVGRVKEKQLHKNPQVSLSVLDPENPFHLVSVSGTATFDNADPDADIDRLAKKYLGVDTYPYRNPAEQRVTVRVTPDNVIYSAGR